ncbi:YegP family protein [Cryobacterium sp. AP23]
MSGKYELTADRSGGYIFKLKAHNGQVLMTSESYQTKADALKGIEIVKADAKGRVVDLTEPK